LVLLLLDIKGDRFKPANRHSYGEVSTTMWLAVCVSTTLWLTTMSTRLWLTSFCQPHCDWSFWVNNFVGDLLVSALLCLTFLCQHQHCGLPPCISIPGVASKCQKHWWLTSLCQQHCSWPLFVKNTGVWSPLCQQHFGWPPWVNNTVDYLPALTTQQRWLTSFCQQHCGWLPVSTKLWLSPMSTTHCGWYSCVRNNVVDLTLSKALWLTFQYQ
jgi:hypothetical protein